MSFVYLTLSLQRITHKSTANLAKYDRNVAPLGVNNCYIDSTSLREGPIAEERTLLIDAHP
ncbi:hypothetical protein PRBRB14_18960 [Hallella multisaccharivorax DSM 17128]|nr:hypothetical protein PRBRB14_18960 [Hallella multisaccharivorax DSM 17128]